MSERLQICWKRLPKSGEKRVKTVGIRREPGPVWFDGFTLDTARRQLTRDGAVLHLTPKAFDLLTLLVEQAPRVVSKRELHERLWKDTFVSDTTLVGVVKELRRVLDDQSRDNPIIRTAHRIGYAFCRPVTAPRRAEVAHWLIVNERRVALQAGDNVIGRDPMATVWLDVAAVSRRHACIVVDGPNVHVEDLGSKNGTMVGDRPVAGKWALRDRDVIRVGTIQLLYRTAAVVPTTETMHPFGG
jgi:DNA-binding winged helix-turn-helix (wHTH) protein